MHHYRNFLCQPFLYRPQMWCSMLFFDKGVYFLFAESCEYFDITFGIGIAYIQPELVKFVWRCIAWVEPHVSGFCFSEFPSIGFSN